MQENVLLKSLDYVSQNQMTHLTEAIYNFNEFFMAYPNPAVAVIFLKVGGLIHLV